MIFNCSAYSVLHLYNLGNLNYLTSGGCEGHLEKEG